MAPLAAACIAALGLAVLMPPALAQTLPPAQYAGDYIVNADVGSPTQQFTQPGVYDQPRTGPYGSSASTTLSIAPTPHPTIAMSSTASSPGVNPAAAATVVQGGISFGQNGALMTYNVEFLGPAGSVAIQVDALVQASMSAAAPGSFDDNLQASLGVLGEFTDLVNITGKAGTATNYAGVATPLAYDPATGISGSITDSHVWIALTNVVYTVGLNIFSELGVSGVQGGGTMSDSVLIDPTFQISSQVADPSLYSVLVSPGVGNAPVSDLPEPASGALMLAGLALIGATAGRVGKASRR